MNRIIILLFVLLLPVLAVAFDYTGDGANGFVSTETVTADNMNEIDTALDAVELGNLDVWAASGDLLVADGANSAAVLTKGTSGYELTAGASTLSWTQKPWVSSGGRTTLQTALDDINAGWDGAGTASTDYAFFFDDALATLTLNDSNAAGVTLDGVNGTATFTGAVTAASFTADPNDDATFTLESTSGSGSDQAKINLDDNGTTTSMNLIVDDATGDDQTYVEVDGATDSVIFTPTTVDMGGTNVEIENGTAPAPATVGEIAIDTTDSGVGGDQLVYYDGTAARALTDVFQECITIEDLAAADDGIPIWMNSAYTDVTLVSASCVCIGTCTTEADIGLDNEETGTPVALTGSITCEDTTTGDTNTAMSGAAATVDQYDVITMDVDNAVSPETDEYVLCINFRPVVQ